MELARIAASATVLVSLVALASDAIAQDALGPVADATSEPAPPPPPPALAPGPGIDVVIDPALPGEDPWRVSGLHRGDTLSAARIREALRAALATGAFADARASVRALPDGYVLVLRGERRVRVQDVSYTFAGGRSRSLENVRTDLGVFPGAYSTDADITRATARLTVAYHEAGWEDATVRWSWRFTDDAFARVLLVTVREGPVTRVRRIVVQPATLPSDVQQAVRDASRIAVGGPIDPAAARRAVEPITAAIRRNGYLSGSFDSPRFDHVGAAEVDAVIVVRPGPHYRIQWRGARWLRTRPLEESLRLEEESAVDASSLLILATRVRDYYVRRGFLDVSVRTAIAPDGPTRAVLRFHIAEGRQVWVRGVHFDGTQALAPDTLHDILRDVLTSELSERDALQEPGEGAEDALDGGPGFSGSRPPVRLQLQPERTYVPDLYVEAGRRMVQRYRDQGFLQATVAAPTVQRGWDERGRPVLDVTYRVTEGARSVLEEVEFEGNTALDSARLARESPLRLGVPVSYAVLEETRTVLTDLYREEGFLFARIETRIDRSPDNSRARVRVVIHEGPPVIVGRTVIRGNRETDRALIVERIALRPGDVYRPSLARRTQQQLDQLGVFSSVTVTPLDPEIEAPIKDVLVQVIELPSQFVEGRLGFSTGQGARLGVEYGIRSIGGTAIAVNTRLQAGLQVFFFDAVFERNYRQLSLLNQIRRQISLSLLHHGLFLPFLRVGPNLRSSIDIAHSRSIERQFAIENNLLGFAGTWRPPIRASLLGRPLRQFTVAGALEGQINLLELLGSDDIQTIVTNSRPEDRQRVRNLLLLPEGTTTLFISRVESTIDFRDQVFNPQRGFVCSARAELLLTASYTPGARIANLPIEQRPPEPGHTLSLSPSCSAYLPIVVPNYGNIVLAINVRLGFNVGLQGQVTDSSYQSRTYTNRQFFLGGSDTLRGWLQDTVIPQDLLRDVIADTQSCELNNLRQWPLGSGVDCILRAGSVQRGGDAMFLWRNEVRVPIGSTGLGIAVFLDLGNVWKNPANFNPFQLRAAAGAGVRFATPIGPLAFDYGFNLSPRPELREAAGAFHFSIGVY